MVVYLMYANRQQSQIAHFCVLIWKLAAGIIHYSLPDLIFVNVIFTRLQICQWRSFAKKKKKINLNIIILCYNITEYLFISGSVIISVISSDYNEIIPTINRAWQSANCLHIVVVYASLNNASLFSCLYIPIE